MDVAKTIPARADPTRLLSIATFEFINWEGGDAVVRTWKQENATAPLFHEAQVPADMLATAKPHIPERHAAAAQFSAAADLDDGQNLHEAMVWIKCRMQAFRFRKAVKPLPALASTSKPPVPSDTTCPLSDFRFRIALKVRQPRVQTRLFRWA